MGVVRLFIALYPPREIAMALLAALPREGSVASGRDTPVEQVHLTCHFLGDRDERQIRDIVESLERSCSGLRALTLTPTRLVTLPSTRTPRLIAATMEVSPGVLELHRRLVTRLARPGKCQDHFEPHMTLRRFGPAGGERLDAPLAAAGFTASEACLVKSVIGPHGAAHAVVHRVTLDGAA